MCLGILHGQGQSQKKALKKEYTTLYEKKTTLKAALCAARAIKTGFDAVADFWAENVVDDDDRPHKIVKRRGRMLRKFDTWQASRLQKQELRAKSVGIKVVARKVDILASDNNRIGASREAPCDAFRRRCDSHTRLYYDRFPKIEVRTDEPLNYMVY